MDIERTVMDAALGGHPTIGGVVSPLTAMVSYRHPHRPASLLLRDELTLRGFSVVHDQSTFLSSNHVAVEMETAVATLDALVAYITPDYLYPGTYSGAPRPALDAEFIPAIKRFREAAAAAAAEGADARICRPVVYPLVRGFAGTRESMLQDVRHAIGYDIGDLWLPDREHDAADLEQADAAGAARDVLRRLRTPGAGAGTAYDITLHTRGAGVPAGGLAIDATALLGGELHQVGAPSDWDRLFHALRDLRTVLAAHGPSRRIELIARAHLPAALLFGRVFHQAAGWVLDVDSRHGRASTLDGDAGRADLDVQWSPEATSSNWMSVEVDLLNCDLSGLVTERHRDTASAPAGRLALARRNCDGDMSANDIAGMACAVAAAIKARVSRHRPHTVSIALAAPSAFAVLLGQRLTALYADIELLERDAFSYGPVLTIPADFS